MELRQLKYFVKTAELLNFSEAARNLYITQSTLSQQIKQLEAELGTQLFERNTHGVVLTESGEELLPYARKTLHTADSCVEHIRDIKNVVTGSLNIGVTYTFSPILTETLLSFMKLYPNVKLNIFYKTMEEARQARPRLCAGFQAYGDGAICAHIVTHPFRQPFGGNRVGEPSAGKEAEGDAR